MAVRAFERDERVMQYSRRLSSCRPFGPSLLIARVERMEKVRETEAAALSVYENSLLPASSSLSSLIIALST